MHDIDRIQISKTAGSYVDLIYKAFLTEYKAKDPDADKDPNTLNHLNKLCVRLVFCYYAEDTGIFEKDLFLHYLQQLNPKNAHKALFELFKILNTPTNLRDPDLATNNPNLARFPYISTGLFGSTPPAASQLPPQRGWQDSFHTEVRIANTVNDGESLCECVMIPPFTDDLLDAVIMASKDFDWSTISPTFFGAVFESTLNPVTRRTSGIHYTSIKNIHKVIDPLFYNELRNELELLRKEHLETPPHSSIQEVRLKFKKFLEKLACLTFLDPACGSGNFLTQSYICLRSLENEAIQIMDTQADLSIATRVSTQQFYGIELNDFAVSVAKTAMWIAEAQMLARPKEIIQKRNLFHPLRSYTNIVVGNALRMDWSLIGNREQGYNLGEKYNSGLQRSHCLVKSHANGQDDICFSQTAFQGIIARDCKNDHDNAEKTSAFINKTTNCDTVPYYDYIIGNPPFVGFKYATTSQKEDMQFVFSEDRKPALLDYVCCWFKKAAEYIQHTHTQVGFVSTDSITQGQMVGDLWGLLIQKYHININYAYRSFIWNSESDGFAHVHCVVIGFSACKVNKPKVIFDVKTVKIDNVNTEFVHSHIVSRINPYLVEGDNIIIGRRKRALCDVPPIVMGNQAMDGGNLIIEAKDYEDFVVQEPKAVPYIKRYMMGEEFIKGNKRYCLWLVGLSPNELRAMPRVMERVKAVRLRRIESSDIGARKKAETPHLFRESRNPEHYIAIPITSSARRDYIPMGYLDKEVIAGNTLFILPDATLYHFGVLTSSIHMAWVRAVGARLGMGYRYSKDIVYNNFVWPDGALSDARRIAPQCASQYDHVTEISETAQGILDARALYPESSLADLYDENTMPVELRNAHQANDKAVMKAYGFDAKSMNEASCVAELMRRYAELCGEEVNKC